MGERRGTSGHDLDEAVQMLGLVIVLNRATVHVLQSLALSRKDINCYRR